MTLAKKVVTVRYDKFYQETYKPFYVLSNMKVFISHPSLVLDSPYEEEEHEKVG